MGSIVRTFTEAVVNDTVHVPGDIYLSRSNLWVVIDLFYLIAVSCIALFVGGLAHGSQMVSMLLVLIAFEFWHAAAILDFNYYVREEPGAHTPVITAPVCFRRVGLYACAFILVMWVIQFTGNEHALVQMPTIHLSQR